MTNPAIMQLKIELSKAKSDFKEKEIKILRLLNELQNCINPFYENVEDIKAVEIEQIGDELKLTVAQACELQKKISKIEKELN